MHIRPRSLPPVRCLELAKELVPRADATGGWIVVNGRADIARVAGAHGVQLGRGSLPIDAVRRVLDPGCVVGVSIHGLEESREASALGADFLLLGTIFSTPSHPGMPGSGVELISSCAGVGTPVIAIGGIDVQSVGPVISAGAHGVAVIRAVLERDDPAAEVRRLICALEEYTETVDPPAEGEARV